MYNRDAKFPFGLILTGGKAGFISEEVRAYQ